MGIGAQTLQPHEVILVDSGSVDKTVAIAESFGVKILHISKDEFTFGRALNKGCAAATGDICVFPSAHVYPVFDTWLEKLAEPFENERVVLTYGRQRGDERNKFSEHQIFARWFPPFSSCPQDGYFCNNANSAIRRSVWENQPYDETLTGLEDLAWAKEAQTKGGWLAYVAEAEIIHVHEEAWEQVRNRYRREAIAMRTIDKHVTFSAFDFVSLLLRNITSDLKSAFQQNSLSEHFASILQFRYNQLLGTYWGYNGPPEVSEQLRKRFYYPLTQHDRRVVENAVKGNIIDYEEIENETSSKVVPDTSSSETTTPIPFTKAENR